ncbi:hypothetical protein BKA70DRAFT_1556639 [Coprinopsis sp. MPI-PUGE-AT-0042]|nr:hypothetical protein BKA70DRAFT_1556639 [Coprinopsis sp. MPI-PUGE-AT-0042]
MHDQTKPGPKEGPFNCPTAIPVASRAQTQTHPVPAEWGAVLLRKELLKKITIFLDPDSIFSLGRTCRSLNEMVFTHYVTDIHPTTSNYAYSSRGHLSAPTTHPEGLLTAFRCSLTLHASLKSISYGFLPNHGFQGLIQDLYELYTLFQRQPRALEYVSLYFFQLDYALKMPTPSHGLTPESFRDKLCSVLDAAIRKGARFLDINGGCDTLQTLHDQTGRKEVHLGPKNPTADVVRPTGSPSTAHSCDNQQASHDQPTSRRRSFFSSISMHLRPSKSKGSPGAGVPPTVVEEIDNPLAGPSIRPPSFSGHSFSSPLSLEELQIRTDMLLSPLFLSWTLDLLKNNARKLRKLKFECSSTPSLTWHEVFNCVPLPRLQKLEIIVAPLLVEKQLDIDRDDILLLLSRCKAVEDVILYGVRPRIPSSGALQDLHSPQLVSFSGHPLDVLWILRLPVSAVPKLGRVVVTTEYYASASIFPFDHSLINEVLEVLDADERGLVLGFKFKIQGGLEEWMQDRINQQPASLNLPLRNIRSLEISFSWYMNFSLEKLQVVSKFINIFPNVEHVLFDQFVVSPNERGMGDVAAAKAFFSKHLSRVKTVKINSEAEIVLDRNTPFTEVQPGPREQVPGPPIA